MQSNMLPHGVKRHLQNPESAQVITAMLVSGNPITAYDIGKAVSLPSATIKSRLLRMRDLGIVSINRTPKVTKWEIPVSFQNPLRDYMQEVK